MNRKGPQEESASVVFWVKCMWHVIELLETRMGVKWIQLNLCVYGLTLWLPLFCFLILLTFYYVLQPSYLFYSVFTYTFDGLKCFFKGYNVIKILPIESRTSNLNNFKYHIFWIKVLFYIYIIHILKYISQSNK